MLSASQCTSTEDTSTTLESNSPHKSLTIPSLVKGDLQQDGTIQNPITARAKYSRTIVPFIPAHDIPRGILYSLQMLMVYILMLAVMYAQYSILIHVLSLS